MRVVLDPNVLVSAFATRGLCTDLLHLVLAENELVLGASVLGEPARALGQKLAVPPEVARETDAFLRAEAEVVTEAPALGIPVRDEDDVVVLEQAAAGAADVLVTGDRDLLDLPEPVPMAILSPRGFWDLLRSGRLER